jgi:hypothetical protein
LFLISLIIVVSGLPHIDSFSYLHEYDQYIYGPSVTVADIDEDGLFDLLLVGDGCEGIEYYRNTGDGFEQQPSFTADGSLLTYYGT